MSKSRANLPDGTYVELVRDVYATVLPTAIIAISFAGVGVLTASETSDLLLEVLIGLGLLAMTARMANLLHLRARAQDQALDAAGARYLERRFAFCYVGFALLFGAFSARAFQVATPGARMLVVGLMFGYGAGVAAGISMRPKIAIPSLVIAILPATLIAPMTANAYGVAIALLLLVFLGGGIQSVAQRYQIAVRGITMRQAFETLARSDALTGLNNRLSLREGFDDFIARGEPAGIVVIHCLDLDRFKPVNDTYGHPAGDALLRAVSQRLNRVLRQGDIAARIGGDEFVILQCGACQPGEADLLARRIVREIARPFLIKGHRIVIGTSIGYATFPDQGGNLDTLIARADEALCGIKRRGGGVAPYAPAPMTQARKQHRRLSA